MKILKQRFAILAILTLAIGIGANTAIFTVANSVLFRDLPYKEPSRLIVALFGGDKPVSPADFFALKNQNTVFEHVSASEYWTPSLTGRDQPEQLRAVRVTDNLFDMLGVQAAIGRTFTASEELPAGAPHVVLSDGLWRRRFGASKDVIGQSMTLDGRSYRILGVMPPAFGFPLFWATRAELWVPLPLGNRSASSGQSLRVFARLKPGVGMEQAQTEVRLIGTRLAQQRSDSRSEMPLEVVPLHDKIVGNVRSPLLLLLATVAFVLLIACVNVANLLLARGQARRREMAVRAALGASRVRLIRQLLAENAVLAVAGAGLGLIMAQWGLGLLVAKLPQDLLPRQEAIAMDARVFTFVLFLTGVATLLFGALPALQASRTDLNDTLRDGCRGTGSRKSHWRRRILAAAEIALSVVLLIGAGLMIRSFERLESQQPGFVSDNVLTMTVSVAGTRQSPAPLRAAFYREMVDRVKGLNGIESASMINHLPLGGDTWKFSIGIEGQVPASTETRPAAVYRVVYPGYFKTMKIPLRGRDFDDRDREGSPGVVVVNSTLAQEHFPGQDPIGKRIQVGSEEWLSIVGVIPDVKQGGWVDRIESEVYLPLLQCPAFLSNAASPFSYMTLVVRSTSDPVGRTAAIRRKIRDIEPNAPVSSVATMDEVVGEQLSRPRTAMMLLSAFGAVGLLLAAIGVYGVMSTSVSQRVQEIGLRTALGARPRDVFMMILADGFRLTAAGTVIGLVVAFAVSGLLRGFLFEVQPSDPLTFLSVPLVMAIVAMAACAIPARQALKADPISSIRSE